jgi:hypothetical protein
MEGIYINMGIVPVPDDHGYECKVGGFKNLFTIRYLDHHKAMKKSGPSKSGRKYKPIHIPAVGSLYNKTSIPGISYTGISDDNQYYRGGVEHRITIVDHQVFIDGMKVTSAPAHMKPTPALRFCKAVITSLITDEENFDNQYSRICAEKDRADLATMDPAPVATIEPAVYQYPAPIAILKPAGWIPHLRLCIEEVPA